MLQSYLQVNATLRYMTAVHDRYINPIIGNNPRWCYNNKFDVMVDRCTEIIFRLFQEDIADDDWLAEGMFYS